MLCSYLLTVGRVRPDIPEVVRTRELETTAGKRSGCCGTVGTMGFVPRRDQRSVFYIIRCW